jgi:hypothetical protein
MTPFDLENICEIYCLPGRLRLTDEGEQIIAALLMLNVDDEVPKWRTQKRSNNNELFLYNNGYISPGSVNSNKIASGGIVKHTIYYGNSTSTTNVTSRNIFHGQLPQVEQ